MQIKYKSNTGISDSHDWDVWLYQQNLRHIWWLSSCNNLYGKDMSLYDDDIVSKKTLLFEILASVG